MLSHCYLSSWSEHSQILHGDPELPLHIFPYGQEIGALEWANPNKNSKFFPSGPTNGEDGTPTPDANLDGEAGVTQIEPTSHASRRCGEAVSSLASGANSLLWFDPLWVRRLRLADKAQCSGTHSAKTLATKKLLHFE